MEVESAVHYNEELPAGGEGSGFIVSQEPFRRVLGAVMPLLNSTRTRNFGQERFEWLYGRNPDGEAVLWTIRDLNIGEVVGYTTALPRRMSVDGRIIMCWNGADFSIHPKYRTLGPALLLRKTARDGVDAGRSGFFYSHPNDRMARIHERAGLSPVGRMIRYAKPLSATPYIRERNINGTMARAVGCLADASLRLWRHRLGRGLSGIRHMEPARFDHRFDELFERNQGRFRIIGVRDARYLEWRYAENPLEDINAILAEGGRRLRGYLLYRHLADDNTAYVPDIFPRGERKTVRDLIGGFVCEGGRRGWKSVSVVALESNPVLAEFEEAGFRRRPDTSQMYGYAPFDSKLRDLVLDKRAWYITVGDRDV